MFKIILLTKVLNVQKTNLYIIRLQIKKYFKKYSNISKLFWQIIKFLKIKYLSEFKNNILNFLIN